ncbi:MAG: hypothetical protein WDN08_17295 [Rhizomicrobium sp.]
MIVRYRAQALADIDEIDRYLRERSPTGALNVLRAINSSIDRSLHGRSPIREPKIPTFASSSRRDIATRYSIASWKTLS